ncbi:MAG: hypothetical protein R2708_02995 [Vicinamibacterales bacterium]
MTRRRAAPAAAALLAAAASAAGAQTSPGQSGLDERRNAAVTLVTGDVERFTGPVERHCGIFTLPADPQGPPAAGRRQIATALKCIREAKRRGRPSWAVWQVSGVDATVFAGLAVTPLSDVHLVDSGGNASDVHLRPCLRPRVDRDGGIRCTNAPVEDPGGIARAIDRLGDDVTRAAGKEARAAVRDAAREHTPGPDRSPEQVVQAVAEHAAARVRRDTGADWPLCPIHRDHTLELREQHWLCAKDGVFVARLGRLKRLRPARPLP